MKFGCICCFCWIVKKKKKAHNWIAVQSRASSWYIQESRHFCHWILNFYVCLALFCSFTPFFFFFFFPRNWPSKLLLRAVLILLDWISRRLKGQGFLDLVTQTIHSSILNNVSFHLGHSKVIPENNATYTK